jgi:hypothetical protein
MRWTELNRSIVTGLSTLVLRGAGRASWPSPNGTFVAGRLPRREPHREMSVVAALRQDGRAPSS